MPQNTVKRLFGPVALSATLTTNIYNPPTGTGGVPTGQITPYGLIRHIHVSNRTNAAHNFTLYVGATGANAAGTDIAVAKNVPANDYVEMYFNPGLRMDAADFLVGGADLAASLTITGFGEIGT